MKIYWHMLLLHEGGGNTTSIPKPSGEQGGAKPQVPPQPTQPKLNFTLPGASPIPRSAVSLKLYHPRLFFFC